ncbi:uncharacterized protein METZ01_LOCUS196661, partial [marine metagenome]
MRKKARKNLLTLVGMISEPYREEEIFSAFEDAAPIEWGGNSSIGDEDFKPCKMVVIGKDLDWTKSESGTYSLNIDEASDSPSRIVLEGGLNPLGAVLLCQVRKNEPGTLTLRSVRKYEEELLEEEITLATEDLEGRAAGIINRLVTDYPTWTHITDITHEFASEMKIDRSISISGALRHLGLGESMFDFIEQECEGVLWQGSQVCKNRSLTSPGDIDDFEEGMEFGIYWVKKGGLLVPEDPLVAVGLITNLYNIVIDHGEEYWYSKKNGQVKVKEWRRAVYEAFYEYKEEGEIFHKCNYLFHRMRFTLGEHRMAVFDNEIGPVVLPVGYILHLRKKKPVKWKPLDDYLTSVVAELGVKGDSGTDLIRAVSPLELSPEDKSKWEDIPFLQPSLWDWIVGELVEQGSLMSTFREWKTNSIGELNSVVRNIKSDSGWFLNRPLRDKIYSLA